MASSTGIRAGMAYVELLAKDNLSKGLAGASKSLKVWATSVTDLGKRLMKLGAIVATPLVAAAKASADAGDSLVHMSERTGVSVEALSVLVKAAALADLSMEDLDGGLRKMQKTLVDAATGSETAQTALAMLGLSVKDLDKLSLDQQFKLIGDRLSKIANPTLRAATAMDIFGRSGTAMLPLFADGAAGLEEMEKYFRSLGMVMTREGAEKAHAFSKAMEVMWMVVKRATGIVGAALIPTLSAVVARIVEIGTRTANWIKANQELVVTVFKVSAAVLGAGAALVVLGKGIAIVAGIIKGVSVACAVFGSVIGGLATVLGEVMTPLGGVIVLLGSLAAYVIYATGAGAKMLAWLGAKFGELRDTALAAFKGITDAMAAGNFALAARIAWLGMKIAWQQGTAELQRGWLTFAGWFQKIAYGAFYGVQAIGEQVAHGIVVAWINGVSYMKVAWVSLTSLVSRASEEMANGMVKAWIWAKSKTDPNFDAKFASEYASKQHDQESRRIDQEKKAALAAVEAERQASSDYEARQHDARLSEIGQAYNDAAAAVEADKSAKVQAAASELDQAKADLQAAIAQAAKERQASASGVALPKIGPAPGIGGEEFGGLSELLAQSAKRTIGVAGTFNAAETRGLGAGSVADRIANATEKTAENTRKLIDKLRGQAVFE